MMNSKAKYALLSFIAIGGVVSLTSDMTGVPGYMITSILFGFIIRYLHECLTGEGRLVQWMAPALGIMGGVGVGQSMPGGELPMVVALILALVGSSVVDGVRVLNGGDLNQRRSVPRGTNSKHCN